MSQLEQAVDDHRDQADDENAPHRQYPGIEVPRFRFLGRIEGLLRAANKVEFPAVVWWCAGHRAIVSRARRVGIRRGSGLLKTPRKRDDRAAWHCDRGWQLRQVMSMRRGGRSRRRRRGRRRRLRLFVARRRRRLFGGGARRRARRGGCGGRRGGRRRGSGGRAGRGGAAVAASRQVDEAEDDQREQSQHEEPPGKQHSAFAIPRGRRGRFGLGGLLLGVAARRRSRIRRTWWPWRAGRPVAAGVEFGAPSWLPAGILRGAVACHGMNRRGSPRRPVLCAGPRVELVNPRPRGGGDDADLRWSSWWSVSWMSCSPGALAPRWQAAPLLSRKLLGELPTKQWSWSSKSWLLLLSTRWWSAVRSSWRGPCRRRR